MKQSEKTKKIEMILTILTLKRQVTGFASKSENPGVPDAHTTKPTELCGLPYG